MNKNIPRKCEDCGNTYVSNFTVTTFYKGMGKIQCWNCMAPLTDKDNVNILSSFKHVLEKISKKKYFSISMDDKKDTEQDLLDFFAMTNM